MLEALFRGKNMLQEQIFKLLTKISLQLDSISENQDLILAQIENLRREVKNHHLQTIEELERKIEALPLPSVPSSVIH